MLGRLTLIQINVQALEVAGHRDGELTAKPDAGDILKPCRLLALGGREGFLAEVGF
jgi:hypothetical protein